MHDDLRRLPCYIDLVTKLLDEALRQVEQLSPGEQDATAGALLDYVKDVREMH